MSQIDRTDRSAYITLGIILGSAFGVIAGVLTAPKSGRETRQQLGEKANKMQEWTGEKFSSQGKMAAEQIDASIEESEQLISRAADGTKEKVDKAADKAKQATDKDTNDFTGTPRIEI